MDHLPPTDTPLTRPIAAARRHAPMYSPIDKQETAKLVVDSFLFALHDDPHHHHKSMHSCTRNDPPDVLLTRNDDKVVGIELTELVDAKSSQLHASIVGSFV